MGKLLIRFPLVLENSNELRPRAANQGHEARHILYADFGLCDSCTVGNGGTQMTYEEELVSWWNFPAVPQTSSCGPRDFMAFGIQVRRDHITTGAPCWCNPETTYKDPDTGLSVVVHKEPQ
jgi:hypothetical protein